jgi:membrane protease subunit (stomatin/prohibitin family)
MVACENTELKKESVFKNTQYDPTIGTKHNEIVNEVLNSGIISKENSYETNMENVNNYFLQKHNTDVSMVANELFILRSNENARANASTDFDPYVFIDTYKDNYSPEFANALTTILKKSEEVKGEKEEVISIFTNYIEAVKNNEFALEEGEKNALLNILTVYVSSAEIWYEQGQVVADGKVSYEAKDDAWKIVVADGVEGLAGGILGGPLGALVGMAAGSITSWTSML